MTDFAAALQKVLVHEGGYVDHPKDPGGPTNKGVTQRVYDSWRKVRGLPAQSVKLIANSEMESIYRERYWKQFKGDRLPKGVSYVVFDGAVNSGVGQSVKWLQRALGSLYRGPVDGLIGETTLQAIDEHPDHDRLIAEIIRLRLAFLKALKTWKTFARGWAARVAGVLKVGQAWATGSVAPQIAFVEGGQAKALITDAKSAPPKAPGDAVAGGGTLGTIISQSIDQITPYAVSPFVQNVLVGLTVASVALAAGGLAYRFWAARRKAELEEALGT